MSDKDSVVKKMDRKTEDDPKVPRLQCIIPRGALVPVKGGEDGERKALNIVVLRELRGGEEDILSDKSLEITERLNEIVGRCIVSISDGETTITDAKSLSALMHTHPWGLSLADVLTLLLRLREVTVGDEFRQKVTCRADGCTNDPRKPYSWTHVGSLSDLEVIPCSGNAVECEKTFTTSRGTFIRWSILTAEYERRFAKKKMPKDLATRALMLRVNTVGDQPVTKENLKDLAFIERAELRKEFDVEGGIETDLKMVCGNCGEEFKVPLEIDAGNFFHPLVTSES